MNDFPWFTLPLVVPLVWAIFKLYKIFMSWAADDIGEVIIDWPATRRIEDMVIARNLVWLKGEEQKAHLKADEYRAMLEPEIQCQGCGYFHNVLRCPKCTRMKINKMSWQAEGFGKLSDLPAFTGPRTWGCSSGVHDRDCMLVNGRFSCGRVPVNDACTWTMCSDTRELSYIDLPASAFRPR